MILFLIQWIGGVYCLTDGDFKDANIEMWILCAFIGWFFIVAHIYDYLSSSSTSTSNASSETTTATEQHMTAIRCKRIETPESKSSPPQTVRQMESARGL